jgi:hypothetical protein
MKTISKEALIRSYVYVSEQRWKALMETYDDDCNSNCYGRFDKYDAQQTSIYRQLINSGVSDEEIDALELD